MSRDKAEKQLADIKASPAYKRAKAKGFNNLTDANEQQADYMASLYEDALGEKKPPPLDDPPLEGQWVTKEMNRIISKFKGTELMIKYHQYKNPFKVKLSKIDFTVSSIKDGIKTNQHPRAYGITSRGKEVSFHFSEIVGGPQELIDELEEISSFEEIEGKVPRERRDVPLTEKERKELDKKTYKKTVSNILDKLISNIELEKGKFTYEFIDDKDRASGEIIGKKIIINLANKRSMETPLHELSHPIVTMLRLSDSKLFEKLYQEVVNSGKVDIKAIEFEYRGKLNETQMKEEIIVFALEKAGVGNLYKYNSKNKLVRAVRGFFDWLFEKLGFKTRTDLFNPEAGLLGPKTTIRELANIITNFENRYTIKLDENVFDDVTELSDSGLEITTHVVEETGGFVKQMHDFETQSITESIATTIKLRKKIKEEDFIDKWTKSIDKTYGLKSTKSKVDWKIENRTAIQEAKELLKSKIKFDFKSKKVDVSLTQLAESYVALEGKVEFIYKAAEILLEEPEVIYDINAMSTMQGLKKGEQENVNEFLKDFKKNNPKVKSLKRGALASEYIKFSNKKSGLKYTYAPDAPEALNGGYNELMGSFQIVERPDGVEEREPFIEFESYRMVAHMDIGYTSERYLIHPFKGLEDNTGIGWYAVVKMPGGGVLLHEYQSDVLMEFLKNVRKLEDLEGTITKKDIKTKFNIENIIKLPDIPSLRKKIDDELQISGNHALLSNIAISLYLETEVHSTRTQFHIMLKDNDGNQLEKAINVDDYSDTSHFLFGGSKFIKQIYSAANRKIDLAKEVPVGIKPPNANARVLEVMSDIIYDMDENNIVVELAGFENLSKEDKGKVLNEMINNTSTEWNLSYNTLKTRKFNKFPERRLMKYMSNIMFSYGENAKYSKQEKKDLLEFKIWLNKYRKEKEVSLFYPGAGKMDNVNVLQTFPNKENSFYKHILKLDNEQNENTNEKYGIPRKDWIVYGIDSVGFIQTIENIITPSGNINSEFLTDTGKLAYDADKRWEKIKSTYYDYKREYDINKNQLSKFQFIETLIKKGEYDLVNKYIKDITRHYIHKTLK